MFEAIYVVPAIIGIGLLIAGFLHGHDHGASDAHDHNATAIIPFFSLRFWTYALSAFGIVGLLSTWLTNTAFPVELASCVAAGIIAGLVAQYGFLLARKSESDSMVRESDIVGKVADVQVAVRGSECGRIRIESRGEFLDLLAQSPSGETFLAGEKVVIVDLNGSTAIVASSEAIFENIETQ